MDLYRIIRELVEKRDRLQRIINSLEGMNSAAHPQTASSGKRRGRKSMDSAAREEVSQRMKKYWARRRAEREAGPKNPEPAEVIAAAAGSAAGAAGYNAMA